VLHARFTSKRRMRERHLARDEEPCSGPKGRKLVATPVSGVDHCPEIILSAEGAKQYRPFGPHGLAPDLIHALTRGWLLTLGPSGLN